MTNSGNPSSVEFAVKLQTMNYVMYNKHAIIFSANRGEITKGSNRRMEWPGHRSNRSQSPADEKLICSCSAFSKTHFVGQQQPILY